MEHGWVEALGNSVCGEGRGGSGMQQVEVARGCDRQLQSMTCVGVGR
jgi:hypothetical protein